MAAPDRETPTTPIRATVGRRGALITVERTVIGGYATRALRVRGRGPVAILLHGFGDSADTWSRVLGTLARHRRAAVALDLPGFGTADALHGERVLPELVSFARAAVERYAPSEHGAMLVGNSLGASAALLAAQDGEPALRAVVAIAPAGFDMAGWLYRVETFWLLRMLLRMPAVPDGVLRLTLARIYRELAIFDSSAVDEHLVGTFVRHHRDRAAVVSLVELGRRLRPELLERFVLDRVEVPVELVWGREDRMLPVANAELVRAAIPHARLHLLARCGHCPQVERPEQTARIVLGAAGERATP